MRPTTAFLIAFALLGTAAAQPIPSPTRATSKLTAYHEYTYLGNNLHPAACTVNCMTMHACVVLLCLSVVLCCLPLSF